MILLGILGAVAIGTIVWLVMSAQNEAKELEAQQSVLEQYSDQVEPTLQTAAATAIEMGATAVVRFCIHQGEAARHHIRWPRFAHPGYFAPPEWAASG